ncbi:hydroxyethylthiazole kinase [Legionella drancourtii]|uniref:Hydroxyethylthiazole kinase n=1 Tax=Legionella drancourtii LLAP12 TaxID=658187 RepID=G9EJF9_9GAMM|nr:hydroxyethylthiazole kinase [Legionella drancourtii]EHL32725.1 hydroxyethylthiazole kinase [Legionella drancourtii LLAP12]
MIEQVKSTLTQIKQVKPLVLCLTNYVTMDLMANSLLALGAAPLMSESKREIEELVTISQAVYINIGTLNKRFIERALFAAEIANFLNKPVILDPVGAGASKLRTSAALELLPLAQIVRGNASEIISLTGATGTSKGVETSDPVLKAISSAEALAQSHNKIIVISGPEDYVTDGKQAQTLTFGACLMPLITGMGCTMTAVLSAFVACNSEHFQAAVQATAYFGLCGQLSYQQAKAPAAFRQVFIDNLFHPDWDFFTRAAEGV